MLYKLKFIKEQDIEVSQYLRPGQLVFLRFNSKKGNTEVYSLPQLKSYIGEIEGKVKGPYAEIKNYEPLRCRTNFEVEVLVGCKRKEALERELQFLQKEIRKISKTAAPQEKRRKKQYRTWTIYLARRLLKLEIKRREIEKIYHFTCIDNLASILKEGVISLEQLERKNIKYVNNDSDRLDLLKNSTSWCISHPNWFYLKEVKQRYPSRTWCVIEAPADILWKRKCYFSETNAAHSSIRYRTEAERVGIEPFNKMFDMKVKKHDRKPHWPNKYTTDVQAEVLVMDNVGVSDISGVYFYSNDHMKSINLEDTEFDFPIKICPDLFYYRKEQQA